jgi:hypothetical protein
MRKQSGLNDNCVGVGGKIHNKELGNRYSPNTLRLIKSRTMSRTRKCCKNRTNEKCNKKLWLGHLRAKGRVGDLDIDGRIWKRNLEGKDVEGWTGFIWLRMTNGGFSGVSLVFLRTKKFLAARWHRLAIHYGVSLFIYGREWINNFRRFMILTALDWGRRLEPLSGRELCLRFLVFSGGNTNKFRQFPEIFRFSPTAERDWYITNGSMKTLHNEANARRK